MKKDRRVLIGLALCLFTGLLFAMVFALDSTLSWVRGTGELQVTFADVQGARVADPVYFHGVPCGRVSRVEFRPGAETKRIAVAASANPSAGLPGERPRDDSMAVRLTLSLPQEVRDYMRSGSVARIDKTLTGITVVNLLQGEGDPLPAGHVIAGLETVPLSAVAEKLSGSADLMLETLADVQAVVGDCRQRELVPIALESLQDVGQRASGLVESIHSVVLEQRDTLPRVLERARETLERLNAILDVGPEVVSEAELTLRECHRVARDARRWLRDLRPNIDSTAEDLARAADNVAWLSTDLRHRPWRLLHAPDEEEVKQLELFQTASEYTRGASELRRAMDRLALLIESGTATEASDSALEEILRSLDTRLSRQGAFEDALWQRIRHWAR